MVIWRNLREVSLNIDFSECQINVRAKSLRFRSIGVLRFASFQARGSCAGLTDPALLHFRIQTFDEGGHADGTDIAIYAVPDGDGVCGLLLVADDEHIRDLFE